jgi:four helix bundle protein
MAGGPRKPVIRSYRDLIVWQRGMDLIVLSYGLARCLPRHEMYGLAAQIRRSAVSVPANIARAMAGSIEANTSIMFRSQTDR